MVRRIYVEKKEGLRHEAEALLREARGFRGVAGLTGVRILNRYDAEGLSEADFKAAVENVFSEPQVDLSYTDIPEGADAILAVEALPGQFDQRADSAAQCIQLLTGGEKPTIRTAKVYLLYGTLSDAELATLRGALINPVEAREAALELPETLHTPMPEPEKVATITGFCDMDETQRAELLSSLGLAMDEADLAFLQDYFKHTEHRDPTLTEIRVVDTYWSDHCRHTTFSTHIDAVDFELPSQREAYERYLALRREVYGTEKAALRPVTLMDLGTIAAKALRARGFLQNIDLSEEINACSIRIPVQVNGETEDWLLMFKNETHNHPTEIEPFGGAATCIGGCIRDPLSGRTYVYQAMRVTGCGDPRQNVRETLPGKLPQRSLVQTAAAGYSSYGNQIGLATGLVSELYHPGYIAKHLEIGAVVGAAPADHVVRERPAPGDRVILLGGRTGRDGIGGATGSSKSHDRKSLKTMASEVQKGNAPEERKLQRLFRDGSVTRLIKRCNDFGAGGVSVAIGELADGLAIDLDAVRKKYEGLDGTELAISESQERMAVVVAPENVNALLEAAARENLEAYEVAVVTESPRMVMHWRGDTVVDLSRAFLDTNGAVKHAAAHVSAPDGEVPARPHTLRSVAASLESASQRGLAERFDASIGAGSVLMPFGGKYQRTRAQAMAALLPVAPEQETDDCSVMAWGFDPYETARDPYSGSRDAVVTSLAKLAAAGCDTRTAYLTFQEYFEKLRDDPRRWGKPLAALLGALDAQIGLEVAAIGGKDSMSGSFLDLDVPPTLVSFAIAPSKAGAVLSPEFKAAGHTVALLSAPAGDFRALRGSWDTLLEKHRAGKVAAAWAVEHSVAEGLIHMSFGNGIGFTALENTGIDFFAPLPGSIILELTDEAAAEGLKVLGRTEEAPWIVIGEDRAAVDELLRANEAVLEGVYPNEAESAGKAPELPLKAAGSATRAPVKVPKPRVLIPVFPGTNCEYDSARAAMRAGLDANIFVINNQSPAAIAESAAVFAAKADESQIIFIPGGFSGGDEPEGSAKFITAFFRNPRVSEATMALLKKRGGLMLGICNGFQALIKLGLVPFGEIRPAASDAPTLSYNVIGRHQSRIVRTKLVSNRSPWLLNAAPGSIVNVPISHGEGRFLCPEPLLRQLAENGQIATQYVGLDGRPSMSIDVNPNGSAWAVEGITSPDGRVLGKMGHSERVGPELYRNVPGSYDLKLFASAKLYFS